MSCSCVCAHWPCPVLAQALVRAGCLGSGPLWVGCGAKGGSYLQNTGTIDDLSTTLSDNRSSLLHEATIEVLYRTRRQSFRSISYITRGLEKFSTTVADNRSSLLHGGTIDDLPTTRADKRSSLLHGVTIENYSPPISRRSLSPHSGGHSPVHASLCRYSRERL